MSVKLASTTVCNKIIDDPRSQILLNLLGSELYAVGGAVRDAILNRPFSDIDYTVNLLPEIVTEKLEKSLYRVIPTGLKHQTVTAVLSKDYEQVEITSFRNSKMDPSGGVFLGESIEEDLVYRDFTCNALALKISDGSLIDPLNGIQDLKSGILKAINSPEDRFKEDPLRILRMARIATQLGFKIDSNTYEYAIKMSYLLSSVSIERIRDEFIKILLAKDVRLGIGYLKELNFFKTYIPELQECIDFEQNKFHHKDVFEHTIDVVELSEPKLLTRLSSLLHDVGKPPSLSIGEDGERHFYLHEKIGSNMIDTIMSRLLFPKSLIKAVKQLVYTHMRPIDAGAAGLRRILRDTDPNYSEWRNLKEADCVAVLGNTEKVFQDLKNFDERIKAIIESPLESNYKNLAINGYDLKELGIKESPIYKEILAYCQEIVIENPEKNDKNTLLDLISLKFLAKNDNL